MNVEEAVASIKARAPMAELREQASRRVSRMGKEEELAYLLGKWAKENATPEERAALGLLK